MTLQYADIDDCVNFTQQNLIKRGAFLDMQTDVSDHVAVREMWKGRQKVFEGGDDWEFDIQMDHNHSARFVGMYETDGSAVDDTLVSGKVQPRHVNAHYIYDQREKAFQKGGLAIVNYIKSKYVGMQVSLYQLMEEALWAEPEDDGKTPFGVGYWITRSASEGFNGPNPTNFSAGKAGISQSDYSRYANWTAQYTEVTREDLARKMRTMHRRTQFRSPVSHAQPDMGKTGNGIYMNSDTIGLFEEFAEDRNMNLGSDVDKYGGRVTFKSTPLTYAPKLDDDSKDPVYLIDWKWMAIGVLSGWENQLTKPYMVPGKHLVRRVDVDCTMQMICTNLRRQGVINKA